MNETLLRYARKLLRRGPWGRPIASAVRFIRRRRFSSSAYWEKRYAAGGHSGVGSFGEIARYKADFINSFVEREGIRTVVELGCGDGNQLALYRFPSYVGLDVSATAIALCKARFAGDPSKRFRVYPPPGPEGMEGELTLSIDVLYHLVEEEVLISYLHDLFAAASRFVIIYSTDFDRSYDTPHQVDRNVTSIVAARFPEFDLVEKVLNPYKGAETMSDFFLYRRK